MQVPPVGGPSGLLGSRRTQNALKKTNRSLQNILERLSTSRRINRASDDAAGLSISEQLSTQVRGFKMASRNVADAMSALDIAEGTTNEVSSLLQRNRELALAARNDTLTDDQRAQLDVEYQANLEEINRISSSAQFNTQGVASGDDLASGNAAVQAGANAGDELNLPQIDVDTNALGVAGSGIATSAQAAGALSASDTALTQLNTQRATLGATVNRFESIRNNLSVAEINTQAAESVLRDQDMASGMVELTRQRLLQEGGMRAFARFREVSANHLFGLLQ